MLYEYPKTRRRVKIARPKVDSRLRNIEKMEEKIESDIAEIKEVVTEIKNGNSSNQKIEMAKKSDNNGSKKSIEVCDFTESMANNEEETEVKN